MNRVSIMSLFALAFSLILAVSSAHRSPQTKLQDPACNVSLGLVQEIQSYQGIADQILETVLNGEWKGRTYDQLARFVDLYPVRLTGGQGLEDAIDYVLDKMRSDGLQNLYTEDAQVTHWIRGEESAEIVSPTMKKLRILGLGPSVGTPEEGITAQVLVVHNYTELDEKKDLVPGKIVVYNPGWMGSYGASNMYRGNGAVPAAEYGAVAALVESVTPYSLDTPHTGGTWYSDNVTKIPIASITREDAQLISRLDAMGHEVTVHLKLMDQQLPKTTSRNTFGEITGGELPNEIIVVSGHIDAWDVGQGAQDDAGGCMISLEALAVLQHLGLRPRRTLQAIMWTAEEQGLEGVEQFVNEHRSEMGNYKAAFESDSGTFNPKGIAFAGTPEAGCIVQEVMKLMDSLNATAFSRYEVVGSDISLMIQEGVPGFSLDIENDKYFYYHHSPADTMMQEDPTELDLNTAMWAITSYVLADLSETLPRQEVVS